MIIYVFNQSLEIVGIVRNFDSLTYKRERSSSGSFKMAAPYTDEIYALLQEDYILYWEDMGKRIAVYIDTVICEMSNNEQTITVSGKNIRGFLGRRIVWANVFFNGTVEGFARYLITSNFVNPTDADRKISNIIMGDRKGITTELITETENENVEELLDSISQESGIIFDLVLDITARKIRFECRSGVDHRTTQNTNPWIVVSQERNNALSDTYTRSNEPYRNTALVGGYKDKETGAQYEAYITSKSGLDRREIYVSGSTSEPKANEDEGITLEQAVSIHRQGLLQKGREKLAQQICVRSVETEADSRVVEQIDVGDYVTLQGKKYGIAQTYVSSITAYYERGGKRYDITFGDAAPSLTKRVVRRIQ